MSLMRSFFLTLSRSEGLQGLTVRSGLARRMVRRFVAGVDSGNVMVNCSTRFSDGFEFGLGAEIGISTDKFHARGPLGLRELTSYKWVIFGSGQVRP